MVGFGLALAAAGRRGWEDAQALMQDADARSEPKAHQGSLKDLHFATI